MSPITPADAIEAIWDAVQSAADGYHNTQQWCEEGHFAPDVSYWKQIRAAVDLAKSLAPTPAAQGAVENGVVLLKGLLPTIQNAVLEEMVRLILAHRPPAVQGGETREAAMLIKVQKALSGDWMEGWHGLAHLKILREEINAFLPQPQHPGEAK